MHYSLALILPSLRKCVRTAIKNMVREKKKPEGTSMLYLASGPRPNAVNSSDFAAEHNKDEVLEGKFLTLNFSPSTRKQLSILLNFFFSFVDIRYIFSSLLKTSVLSNNRFAK